MGHVFVGYARGDGDIIQKVIRELDGAMTRQLRSESWGR